MKHRNTIIWSIAILCLGALLAVMLVLLKPRPQRQALKMQETPVTIEVKTPGNHTVKVEGYGSVKAAREIVVRPHLTGTVVDMHSGLKPGMRLKKGELIALIDKRDYEIALKEAQAQLQSAQSALQIEQGNQAVAKRELELLKRSGAKIPRSTALALREPQQLDKEAKVTAAESLVARAALNLERTRIIAPFDAFVLEENLDIGQYVTPQNEMAKLIDYHRVHVEVSIPENALPWIRKRTITDNPGSSVIIKKTISSSESISFEGEVISIFGNLTEQGRIPRILIEVKKPFDGPAPLLLNSYVKALITGPSLQNTVRLERKALRDDDTIWLLSEKNTLLIIPVEVINSTDSHVLVKGLTGTSNIITSYISNPIEGMKLRVIKR